MNAAMLDMEFLDTRPTAAILSIGIVAMDTEKMKIGETLYLDISADDCMRHGMTVSAETIRWWINQDIGALRKAFDEQIGYKHPLELALVKVSNFLTSIAGTDKLTIWQQGSLDAEILTTAYRAVGKTPPWNFWNVRDLRTLAREVQVVHTNAGTKHNALDDAKNQAELLMKIYAQMRGIKAKPTKPVVADDDEL